MYIHHSSDEKLSIKHCVLTSYRSFTEALKKLATEVNEQ